MRAFFFACLCYILMACLITIWNKIMANPVGRPSKYDPAFCETAITFLADGYSVTALAGHMGVARSTVFKWAEENAEFSDALTTGQALAAAYWEKLLLENARTGNGNAASCIFGVKNRSRVDWKDKTETEITGADGGPVDMVWTVKVVE